MLKEYQYHTCTYTNIYIHTSHRCYKSIAKWVGAVKVPIPLPRIRVHIHLHTYITQVLQEYRKMGWCWKSTNTITTHTRTHTSTTYIHHTGAASVSQNGLVLEKYQYHYHTYMYTYIYIHTSHRCCKSITKWVGAGRVPRPLPHTHAHAHPHTPHRCRKSITKWVGAGRVPRPLLHIHVHVHLHTYITQVLQENHKNAKSNNATATATRIFFVSIARHKLWPATISMAMAVRSRQNNCCGHFPRKSIVFFRFFGLFVFLVFSYLYSKLINFHSWREIFPAVSAAVLS